MKISKTNLARIVQAVRSNAEAQSIEETELTAYYLDDITLLFNNVNGTQSFYGLVVDVLGRSFHIVSDLSIMIEDTSQEDEEESIYVVEDDRITEFLNDFFDIRSSLLETFGA